MAPVPTPGNEVAAPAPSAEAPPEELVVLVVRVAKAWCRTGALKNLALFRR
jgi:hypothetical protein